MIVLPAWRRAGARALETTPIGAPRGARSSPRRRIGAALFALAVFGFAALWPTAAPIAAARCSFAGLPEAKAMAERAAELLGGQGPEVAFPAFMDTSGPFFDRDLYVFVLLLDGTIVLNGRYPDVVGSNLRGATNARGQPFGLELLRTAARQGRGTVEYEWYNPCTGQIAPKVTYFIRVGELIVAVGAYGSISA